MQDTHSLTDAIFIILSMEKTKLYPTTHVSENQLYNKTIPERRKAYIPIKSPLSIKQVPFFLS